MTPNNMTPEEHRRARQRAAMRERVRAKRRKIRRRRRMLLISVPLAFIALIILSVTLFGGKGDIVEADAAQGEEVLEELLEEAPEEDTVYTIVLDSGHSTYNVGAQGIVNEEDITAATTEYLRLLLEADENFEVILTHEYDVYIGIAARRQVGIDSEADFFISIHCNINQDDSSITGFEIYPQLPETSTHEASYAVASYIAEAFIDAGHTARTGTGIFYCRYVTDDNGNDLQYTLTEYDESLTDYGGSTYGVINTEEYPGILIEQGYVNSQTDVDNWMSEEGMENAAQIYYAALCDYFGTEPIV